MARKTNKARKPKDLPEPRVVRVKPHTYQPTKAEMEAIIEPLRLPDGSLATPEQAARVMLRP
ncbi:MAG: hypothetical protein OXH59_09770, partial [Rhodospirillaceae bacterium]|nr:hypothetical protein [Rhodospirillaceae bacterium]